MSARPEPITWQLVQYLCQRVRAIDGTGGWYTDMSAAAGVAVIDDRTQFDARSRTPAALVHVPGMSLLPDNSGPRTKYWQVEIVLEFSVPAAAGVSAMQSGHRALDDLRTCLMGDLRDAPLRITSLELTAARVEMTEGADAVIAHVSAQATVNETLPPA